MDPTQQGQPQGPPPEPFVKADDLQLQRLNQAMSKAKEELDDGNLKPEEYQMLMGQIQQRLGPLQQRQKADQDQKMKQQFQMQMQQHAQQEAMNDQAAKARAKSLIGRIVDVYDINSGKIAKLFESKPNHWEEIKFEASKEDKKEAVPSE